MPKALIIWVLIFQCLTHKCRAFSEKTCSWDVFLFAFNPARQWPFKYLWYGCAPANMWRPAEDHSSPSLSNLFLWDSVSHGIRSSGGRQEVPAISTFHPTALHLQMHTWACPFGGLWIFELRSSDLCSRRTCPLSRLPSLTLAIIGILSAFVLSLISDAAR